jgi:Uma2 family endonuclease
LVIEVADTTLASDRDTKARHYTASGVPEVWIVDLDGDQILVMRQATEAGYAEIRALGRGDAVDVEALAGLALDVADILGPEA